MAYNLANSVRKCWKCNIGKELFTIIANHDLHILCCGNIKNVM